LHVYLGSVLAAKGDTERVDSSVRVESSLSSSAPTTRNVPPLGGTIPPQTGSLLEAAMSATGGVQGGAELGVHVASGLMPLGVWNLGVDVGGGGIVMPSLGGSSTKRYSNHARRSSLESLVSVDSLSSPSPRGSVEGYSSGSNQGSLTTPPLDA